MADAHGGDPNGDMGMVAFVLGGFAVLVVLWFMAGGPGKADLRGLFLSPLPPLGSGDAYGPTLNSTSSKSH
jgi:hypothetical protein